MLKKLGDYRGKIWAFVGTFALRLGVAFGPLLLTFVISNFYSVSVVGNFTVALSVVLGVSLFSRLGIDQAIIRYIATNESVAERSGILLKCLLVIFSTSSFLVFLSYPFLHFLVDLGWVQEEPFNFLKAMLWAVIPINGLHLIAGFYKGFDNPGVSVLFEYGIGCFVTSLVVLSAQLLIESPAVRLLPFLFTGSFYVILGTSMLLFIRKYLDVGFAKKSEFKVDRKFLFFSASLAVMSLSYFVQNVLVYVIGGGILSTEELGALRIITQVATMISFPLVVINVFAPGRYAKLNARNDLKGLRSFFKLTSIAGLGLALPGILVILFWGEWVLGVFGVKGVIYIKSIQILTLAQIVNVATGSVGFLLTMTGNVHVVRNILVVTLIFGVVIYYFLVLSSGFIGGVLGVCFLVLVPNIASYIYAVVILRKRSVIAA